MMPKRIKRNIEYTRDSLVVYAKVSTLACVAFCLMLPSPGVRLFADDQLQIGDICRLKGQEENTIQGLGLVVGLNGTGDQDVKPTSRALGRMLQLLGANIGTDPQGIADLSELSTTQNVALAIVTATIPAAGAQQGDQLDCQISAIGSKDLTGGNLMITYMRGPRADVNEVFALAQGQISIPDRATPTSGRVYGGCKMESTIKNAFTFDNKITLILDKDIASFSTARDIADLVNDYISSAGALTTSRSQGYEIARAIDQLHVEITIPPGYRDDPVRFIPEIQNIVLNNIKRPKRVVLNEKTGVVVIGEEVLINPVVISHKNLTIEAAQSAGGFVGIDTDNPNQPRSKLKNLVDALNALKVPTRDVIAIIRELDRSGDIYGTVVFN